MSHLHQVFITKSPALRDEVENKFSNLFRLYSPALPINRVTFKPSSFKQNTIPEHSWPLFLTSHEWLIMLDATLPIENSFFDRNSYGEIINQLVSVNFTKYVIDINAPVVDERDLTDVQIVTHKIEGLFDQAKLWFEGDSKAHERAESVTKKFIEIDYTYFAVNIWPTIKKRVHSEYDPILVYTEVVSIIKYLFKINYIYI